MAQTALASKHFLGSRAQLQSRQQPGRTACAQAPCAARFFDRPSGDKKESARFQNSELKKKGTQRIPFDAALNAAWPGKSNKMANARNRGAKGDGRVQKTSSAVPGSGAPPKGIGFLAGGLAIFAVLLGLAVTGGVPNPADAGSGQPTEQVASSQQ